MWTEGRIKSFIISTIRAGFRRWPPKYEALKDAFVQKGINPKTGRTASLYRCAKCQEEFSQKYVQVDHIDPVVDPKMGFISYDSFVERLFCSKENLQVLCLDCHKEKTKLEKQQRKINAS